MTRIVSGNGPRRMPKLAMMISAVLVATTGVGCGRDQASRRPFDAGRDALKQGRFETAIDTLQGYLDAAPTGELASRASFLIAKAHIGLGDYEQARAQFEKTIRGFPNSEEAHKSRYKLGMLSLLKGDHDAAQQRFAALSARPNGTLVPEAIAMQAYLKAREAGELPKEEL